MGSRPVGASLDGENQVQADPSPGEVRQCFGVLGWPGLGVGLRQSSGRTCSRGPDQGEVGVDERFPRRRKSHRAASSWCGLFSPARRSTCPQYTGFGPLTVEKVQLASMTLRADKSLRMARNPEKLSPAEERFCEEYLVQNNGTRAYLLAYPKASESTAGTQASKLLKRPRIEKKIAALKAARVKRTQISQDMVVQELAKIAFLDITRAYDARGQLLSPKDMPEDVSAAVSSLQVEQSIWRDEDTGEVKSHSVHGKLKFCSKVRALEVLLEHVRTTGEGGATSFVDLIKKAAEAKRLKPGGKK